MRVQKANTLQRLCYLEALDLVPLIPVKTLPAAKPEMGLYLDRDWRTLFDAQYGKGESSLSIAGSAASDLAYPEVESDGVSPSPHDTSLAEGSQNFLAALGTSPKAVPAAVTSADDKEKLQQAATATIAPQEEAPKTTLLRFTLSCWQVDDYLIFDEFEPKSAYPVPRFLGNVFSALLNKVARVSSTQTLRWPVVKACSAESGDESAARTMLASMLSSIQRPPVSLVLCGDLPKKLFLDEGQKSILPDFAQFADAKVVLLPSLLLAMKEPAKKREIQDVLFV